MIYIFSLPPLNFLLTFVYGDYCHRDFSLKKWSNVFSHSVMSDSWRPHESKHARPPCPSPTPEDYSNSCPSNRWCHPAITSSIVLFSSCPQSLPASGSFPMSQLFTWGGQSIGVSASASVLPMNSQDWFPLGLTGLISLQFKGLTTVPLYLTYLTGTVETVKYVEYLLLWILHVQTKSSSLPLGLCESSSITLWFHYIHLNLYCISLKYGNIFFPLENHLISQIMGNIRYWIAHPFLNFWYTIFSIYQVFVSFPGLFSSTDRALNLYTYPMLLPAKVSPAS